MAPVIVESSGHARKVVVACILLPIFSTVFVVIRVVTRQLAVGHSLSWDDCEYLPPAFFQTIADLF